MRQTVWITRCWVRAHMCAISISYLPTGISCVPTLKADFCGAHFVMVVVDGIHRELDGSLVDNLVAFFAIRHFETFQAERLRSLDKYDKQ